MLMKFGINTWVWTAPLTTEVLSELAPKVAGIGFDWIETPLENLDDLDYLDAKTIIQDNGLLVSACAAMGPDRDLIHEDAGVRQNGMDYLKGCIEACEMMGATNLVGPLYSAVGRTWQQTPDERAKDLDLLVKNLSALSAYANDHGVKLGIEPLNRFETSFINLANQAVEVVDRVNNPSCGIMLDTFHMNIEEKSLSEAIKTAGSRLIQVHTCENDRGAPGSGTVTWQDVKVGLEAINYDGPLVIESFTPQVKSIARAAAIWRPLAASPEELARNGLEFLRRLMA
jgi:D-psicose/D-tagatose/L-ribulose 3-epimerase